MKRIIVLKQKLLLVFVAAILFICAGFIFISCGEGPQSKIADPDKGAFSIDFSNCSGDLCRGLVAIPVAGQDSDTKIANKDLTIEAWVKSKGTVTEVPGSGTPSTFNTTFTGGIFGHIDTAGIVLYVKNGFLKAAIRRVGASGTATATADYIVNSGVQILDNAWHHIAAVLTGADHSAVHSDCGAIVSSNRTDTVDCSDAGTVCNNDIHLDIYVDGEYKECNTTYGEDNDTTVTQPAYAGETGQGEDVEDSYISVGIFFGTNQEDLDGLNDAILPGVVDEARLWGVARTQSQINQCMSRELSLDSGTCGRMTSSCISYLRFNEGTGAAINDWCGLGTGVLELIVDNPAPEPDGLFSWPSGWTTNTPGLKTSD